MEEDGNKQQEEDKIRTTMQCSAVMQQSCTHGPRKFFLSSERGVGGGEGEGGGG